MIKVIFLDIDGVLNFGDLPAEFSEGWPESHLETLLIMKLNKIIESVTNAKVVISSSWRVRFTLNELTEILINKGFVGEIIDMTPRDHPQFGDYISRGDEIQAWLNFTENDIESFVIIDDVDEMPFLNHRLVKTDDSVGLTDSDVDKAIITLGVCYEYRKSKFTNTSNKFD